MTTVRFTRKPFRNSFNTMVDDLFADLPVVFRNVNNPETKGSVPVNVQELDNSYKLEVVAPGFEKADFKINIDQNLLTIEADSSTSLRADSVKEDSSASLTAKQIRREYNYSSFKRSFTLDEKIDATNIEASYINGVLTLNLPKKEEVKASSTEIIIK